MTDSDMTSKDQHASAPRASAEHDVPKSAPAGKLRERIATMSDDDKKDFLKGSNGSTGLTAGLGKDAANSLGVTNIVAEAIKPMTLAGSLIKGLDFPFAKGTQPAINIPDPADYGLDVGSEYRGVANALHDLDFSSMPANRAAAAAEQTAEYTHDLLEAMRQSVVLSEQTRQESASISKFTRIVGWFSIVGTAGSILVAVASLVVAIVALNKP